MDDERSEELDAIQAIFPELVLDPRNSFAASLALAVTPTSPFIVDFSAATLPTPPSSKGDDTTSDESDHKASDEHALTHLPTLRLDISLPDQYPSDLPPFVSITTSPAWLPLTTIKSLEEEATKLWEDYGHCQVLFSYIDYLQQAAEKTFGLPDHFKLSRELKSGLLDFNRQTQKKLFDAGTFDCGICLEPKKGSTCHRMHRCGHVFCLSCLQDFYNSTITEGDVVNVKCLDPGCGKDDKQDNSLKRKRRTERTLHPRELVEMEIPEPNIRRYVEMKQKKRLESDKATVYCPRTWCQGPARNAKYRPIPADLSQYPDSDSDVSDAEGVGTRNTFDKNTPDNKLPAPADRLAICSKCSFAFCRVCYTGWHGEIARCWPRNPSDLSVEEKASYDYIRLHTSPCPTCSSPTQKTMGCNHMKCFQCNTHFCYLCGAWLDAQNPYQHFNSRNNGCFQRLWELEEGDEGNGGAQFAGARGWEAEAIAEEGGNPDEERFNMAALEVDLADHEVEPHVIEGDPGNDAGALDEYQGILALLNEQWIALGGEQRLVEAANELHLPERDGQRFELHLPGGHGRGARGPNQNGRGPGRGGRGRNAAGRARGDQARGGQGRGDQARGGQGRGGQGREGQGPGGQGRGGQGRGGQGRGGRGRGGQDREVQGRGGQNRGRGRNPPELPAEGPHIIAEPGDEHMAQEQQAAAFRRFVDMAARDEEDDWDSDELEDDEDWEIRG